MICRACRKSARRFTACCALLCAVKTGSGEYPAAGARSICVLFNHTCARAAGSSYENERCNCHQRAYLLQEALDRSLLVPMVPFLARCRQQAVLREVLAEVRVRDEEHVLVVIRRNLGFRPERTLWNLVALSLLRHVLGIRRLKVHGHISVMERERMTVPGFSLLK